MKNQLSLLFFFTFSLAALCQSKTKVYTPPPMRGDLNCVYKPKYSAAKRLQFYPFNIADTIKIVSFRYHNREHPIKKDSLLVDSLVEIKILTNAAINQLTDILYNNFYKKIPNYGVSNQCFWPRNAILFFNKDGRMIESVVLCFHCENYELSSENVKMGDDCEQKMEKIRKFFLANGLRFGTDLSIFKYPDEGSGEGIVLPPEERK